MLMTTTKKHMAKDADRNITISNYDIAAVDELIYLGTLKNASKDIGEEIKMRIMLADQRYYGLSK